MSVYVYCIKDDYPYKSSMTGRSFENEWFRLSEDGTVIVKGTNHKGYAWDGCSPKFKIKDWYFGTWEAVLNFDTGQSKTYYASLIHDVFYQFAKDVRSFIKREEVDKEFLNILRRDGMRCAKVYYVGVRSFGWIWWYSRKEVCMKILGVLLLILAAGTVFGMVIQNDAYWNIYNYVTLVLSVASGIALLKK